MVFNAQVGHYIKIEVDQVPSVKLGPQVGKIHLTFRQHFILYYAGFNLIQKVLTKKTLLMDNLQFLNISLC